MSYALNLTRRFERRWQSLPLEIEEGVLDALEDLARYPTRLSRKSRKASQRFQVFRFTGSGTGGAGRFEIRFQYGQDEQTLHILDIVAVDR